MSKHDSSTAEIGEKPWIGVDFDGVLATYEGWLKQGPALGRPVTLMIMRIKSWLAMGTYEVRIVTARASTKAPNRLEDIQAIKAWCEEHLGRELEVTAEKDFSMHALWDDRAIHITPNSGELGWPERLIQECYE